MKNLSTLRKGCVPATMPVTFLKLPGLKFVIIKDYPRKVEAWLVHPSENGEDCKCEFITSSPIVRRRASAMRLHFLRDLLARFPEGQRV